MIKIKNTNKIYSAVSFIVLGTALISALSNNYGIALAGIVIYLTSIELRR